MIYHSLLRRGVPLLFFFLVDNKLGKIIPQIYIEGVTQAISSGQNIRQTCMWAIFYFSQ